MSISDTLMKNLMGDILMSPIRPLQLYSIKSEILSVKEIFSINLDGHDVFTVYGQKKICL